MNCHWADDLEIGTVVRDADGHEFVVTETRHRVFSPVGPGPEGDGTGYDHMPCEIIPTSNLLDPSIVEELLTARFFRERRGYVRSVR